jgi:hypothetical protein
MVFDNRNQVINCQIYLKVVDTQVSLCDQVIKGKWWMPRRREAMKGVADCDNPRGAVKQALYPRVPEWGNPAGVMPSHSLTEYIGLRKLTQGSEPSQYLEE